jgi:peptide/nickel transport system permease protein
MSTPVEPLLAGTDAGAGLPLGEAEPTPQAGPSSATRTLRAYARNPLGVAAVAVMLLLICVAIFAPLIRPYPRGSGNDVLVGPSSAHWFGTDNLGLDIFAQLVWGTRDSMTIAFAASFLAVSIGVVVAVIGAYFRRFDTGVGMFVDLCLSLPVLPLMILVAALAGPSLKTIVLVIAFFSWPEVSRVVRSQALTVVKLPYIDAAKTIGGGNWWIIRTHVIPAITPVIVVSVVLTASRAVLAAAGLSFLGLGDPTRWSWGQVLFLSEQAGAMQSAWWTTLFPSLAILMLVMSATLISISYNDARDPRIRED